MRWMLGDPTVPEREWIALRLHIFTIARHATTLQSEFFIVLLFDGHSKFSVHTLGLHPATQFLLELPCWRSSTPTLRTMASTFALRRVPSGLCHRSGAQHPVALRLVPKAPSTALCAYFERR